MAGPDSRLGDRVPAAMRIKLKYPDVDTFIQKYSVNISRGGIFIATRQPKPVGTLLRFEFQLASALPVIRGEGQVIWVKPFDPEQPRRVHGMGVRFMRLDSESRAIVDRALQWKHEQREAAAPEPGADEPGAGGIVEEALTERVNTAPEQLPPAPAEDPTLSQPLPEAAGADPVSPAAETLLPSGDGEGARYAAPSAGASAESPELELELEAEPPPLSPLALLQGEPPAAGPASLGEDREAVAELWQASQSQIVKAARHIAELTAAHVYYPEDAELAELLKPLRVPLPKSGREAHRLLAALLEGRAG